MSENAVSIQQPEITKEMFDFADKTMAATAKEYPLGFVLALAEEAEEIVRNWLQKNHAPAEIVEIHDYSVSFYRMLYELENGNISEMDARELVLTLPDFLAKALKFGDFQLYVQNYNLPTTQAAEEPKAE